MEEIKKDRLLPTSILISAIIIAGAWTYDAGKTSIDSARDEISRSEIEINGIENTFDEKETTLPVKWGDLGKRIIETGVIDASKFEEIYNERGLLNNKSRKLLYGATNGDLVMTQENSGFVLNLLWALGLGNKNKILERGPMSDPKYGGADGFASTGGWTLSRGDSMTHYNRHSLVVLSAEQQQLVERVSKGIYRPCCNNSTYFPDCNHGMAMLGLLGLMASQNVSEEEMYKVALQVNSYWFPDTYLAIAEYLKSKGKTLGENDPKEILGTNYSSALGYQRILSQIKPPEKNSGGSCGV